MTSEPVAMRIFLAATTSFPPSDLLTVTSFGPVMVPTPLKWVTWGGGGEGSVVGLAAHTVSGECTQIGSWTVPTLGDTYCVGCLHTFCISRVEIFYI